MYKWDLEEVKKRIAFLQEQLINTTDTTEELEIESQIYALEDLIDYYDEVLCPSKQLKANYAPENFKAIISDDLQIIKKFGFYFPMIREFNESFDYSKISPQNQLAKRPFKNPQLISLTTAFYNRQSEVFKSTYAELASHFQSRLYFSKPNKYNGLDGETKPIYGTDLVYININKSNTIRDCITTIHESSHGIAYLLNNDVIWDDNKTCFREVDSLFFELLGTDYVDANLNTTLDCHQLKVATFKDYLYSAGLIVSKADMYNALSSKDLNNRRAIKEFLKQEIGCDKIGIQDVMQTYVREYFHYIISYLTAIELYLIYQTDQDFALDLLYKIIMLKDKNNQEYLNEIRKLGIEPGKNMETYFKMLIDTDRKLCYGKNIQL